MNSKIKKFTTALGILCGSSILGLTTANPAFSQIAPLSSFETTITFEQNDRFSRMVFDWAGTDSDGNGTFSFDSGEIESWSLELFDNDNNVVFMDNVVEAFTIQDAIPTNYVRDDGIQFDYTNDDNFLFDNDIQGYIDEVPSTPTGLINTYTFGGDIAFNDGGSLGAGFDDAFRLGYTVNTLGGTTPPPAEGEGEGRVSTPEPSLILGFITLGGVLLGSKRKTNS